MSPSNDPVDAALESLRVHGASPSDSLSHDLEQKLMDADRRSSGRSTWLVKSLIAAAILTGGGVVGYAAVEGRWLERITFDIADDGFVTDQAGQLVGETVENEDGTFSTFIELGEDHVIDLGEGRGLMCSYIETTSDEPLTGKSISIGAVVEKDGSINIIQETTDESGTLEGEQ